MPGLSYRPFELHFPNESHHTLGSEVAWVTGNPELVRVHSGWNQILIKRQKNLNDISRNQTLAEVPVVSDRFVVSI